MKIFVTEMLRWGDDETHHYIIGAYSTLEQATECGEIEKTWRGCKYEYRIIETGLDAGLDEEKVITHKGSYK